jgi:hypothetical protein
LRCTCEVTMSWPYQSKRTAFLAMVPHESFQVYSDLKLIARNDVGYGHCYSSQIKKLGSSAIRGCLKISDLSLITEVASRNFEAERNLSSKPNMSRYQTITSGLRQTPPASHYARTLLSSSAITPRQPGRTLYSTQGYGDGKGGPASEDPVNQGVSHRTRELEHPGPEQSKKKSSTGSNPRGRPSDTSKKGSQNIPPRSAKEELENEMARGRGQ